MSITDELRDWADDKSGEIAAIADRIDAEHEKAAAGCIHYDPERHYCAVHGDTENGWVRLPKDADGVTIRVGDRVQFLGSDPSTVSHMSLASDGWRVYVKYDGDLGTGSGEPNRMRHYTPPTVEDVLREFASDIADVLGGDDFRLDGSDELFAEYAAKLRLAGDGE